MRERDLYYATVLHLLASALNPEFQVSTIAPATITGALSSPSSDLRMHSHPTYAAPMHALEPEHDLNAL